MVYLIITSEFKLHPFAFSPQTAKNDIQIYRSSDYQRVYLTINPPNRFGVQCVSNIH